MAGPKTKKPSAMAGPCIFINHQREIDMFKRTEFDRLLVTAKNHLDLSEDNPVELRNSLIMMMHAMKALADSCENDFNDQLKALEAHSATGVAR